MNYYCFSKIKYRSRTFFLKQQDLKILNFIYHCSHFIFAMRVVLLMDRVSLSVRMSKYKQYHVTDIYISYSQTLSRPVNDEILTDLLENSIFA